MICTACGVTFDPTEGQLKKRRYTCAACNRAFQTKWRESHKAKGLPVSGKKPNAQWWKDYYSQPEVKARRQARFAVKIAVEAGRLTRQPCEKCDNPKSEAHHEDYSQPLNVMWLCRKHHLERHQALKAEGK